MLNEENMLYLRRFDKDMGDQSLASQCRYIVREINYGNTENKLEKYGNYLQILDFCLPTRIICICREVRRGDKIRYYSERKYFLHFDFWRTNHFEHFPKHDIITIETSLSAQSEG